MTRPFTVVFDLDGTLADTAPDIIATLNQILQADGVAPVPVSAARDLVGAGAKALIRRGYALRGRTLDDARIDAMFLTFLDLYAERIAVETRLFPGVEAALDRLGGRGHALAVCTNKPERHSRLLLDALGIADRFAAICGRDSFPMCKPDPRHLTLTIAAAGGAPERGVLIGDSRTDVDTARAAGLPVIGVSFGYSDAPMSELSPDALIAHFDALDDAVERFVVKGRAAAMVGATGIEPVTPPV